MKNPLKYTWELYTNRIEKILVLMVFTTLPLLIIHSYVVNYIYTITPSVDPFFSFADIYHALLTILFLLYAQVPYIRFIYNEYTGRENSLRNSIYEFLLRGISVFLFACIVAFLSTIGFMIFVLPGLLLLTFVFPIPYISVFDEKSVWVSYREGIRLGKKYFFKIFFLIVGTGLMEAFVGSFVSVVIFNITDSFGAQIITQIVLNLIYFPFVIMLLASSIIKWREKQDILEIKNEEMRVDELAEEN